MAGDEQRPSSEPQDPANANDDPRVSPVPLAEGSDAAAAGGLLGADPDAPSADLPETDEALDPRPRGSVMPYVLSGIGALVAALLAVNLYTLYNPPTNGVLSAALADVAELKQQVGEISGRVGAVDARVGAAESKAGVAESKAGVAAGLDQRVTALGGDIDGVKTAVARINDVATTAEQARAAIPPLDARIGEVGKGLADVTATVAALPKVDLGPLEAKAAALDKRLGPLETYFEAPKTGMQVTDARQNGSGAETRAAPLSVIAQGVLAAIDAGRPFDIEVQALAKLGVAEPVLAPLKAVAARGASTRADLLADFGKVQDGIVVAAAPVETGTVLDRIMANAQGLVKVNRTGAVAGPDPAAVTSRIADALRRGDDTAAAAEWDALPEASKARSADWAARLKARVAAETAAHSIEAGAVAALAAAQ